MPKKSKKPKNAKPMPKLEGKANVIIKFGDVMVSVSGDDSERTKIDAKELFSMLEEKYALHWDSKVCKEKTRYG